jgi:hypothetical protein
VLLHRVAVPHERLQTATLSGRKRDADSWTHRPDSHDANPAGIPNGIQTSDFIH